jgi:hypothetical protein
MADNSQTEIEVIKTRMDGLERSVSEIVKAVKSLADQPRPWPMKEVGATVLVCFSLFAYIGGFLEGQYKKNNAVLEYRMEQLEKRTTK